MCLCMLPRIDSLHLTILLINNRVDVSFGEERSDDSVYHMKRQLRCGVCGVYLDELNFI